MASMVRRGRAGVFSARFRFISVCFRAKSLNAIADNHAGRTRNAPGISSKNSLQRPSIKRQQLYIQEHPFVPSALHPERRLRLRALPWPAGSHRGPCGSGRRRAGAHAHGRRQEPVLPGAGHSSPAGGPGRGHRGVAADRADARPGGRAARGGRGGCLPQFHAGLAAGAGRGAAPGPRRDHPALRRARTADHATLPGTAGRPVPARPTVDVRHRRGALREPMGARLPARVPPAHRAARALRQRAAHCPHGHGRCADARRHRRAPAAAGGAAVRQQLRPAQHPLSHRGKERRHHAAAALHRARAPGRRGRGGCLPQFHAGLAAGAGRGAAPGPRRDHPALRRARTADHATLPGTAGRPVPARPTVDVRHRRGAAPPPRNSRP